MTRPSDIPEEIYERADILCDQFRNIEDDRELIARVLMEVGQGAQAPRVGLTERQTSALAFIEGYVSERGHSPSYRDIADGCGLSSRGRAHELVHQLKERGAIAMLPGRVRTIVLADADNVSTARKNIGVA